MSSDQFFIGLEGGASFSRLVVLSGDGIMLAEVEVSSTVSPYFLGSDLAAQKIDAMLTSAANKLKLSRTSFLQNVAAMGLGISGCESVESQKNLEASVYVVINQPMPTDCFVIVCEDTMATALTAFHPIAGGTILISGTGSNCLLMMPNTSFSPQRQIIAKTVTCGGWGSQLGDFGSAYWLSLEAVRHVIEVDECFKRFSNMCSKADCDNLDTIHLKQLIMTKMSITDLSQLFDLFGPKFSKSNVARLAGDISELAKNNDALSLHLFFEAGRHLASMVLGVVRRAEKLHGKQAVIEFIASNKNRLDVACTGSMFKSWSYLKPGFLSVMTNQDGVLLRSLYNISVVCMRRLCCSAAVGAAVFASLSSFPRINQQLSIEWQLNSLVFENIFL